MPDKNNWQDHYKDFLEDNGKILKSKFTHTVSKKFTNIVLEEYYD